MIRSVATTIVRTTAVLALISGGLLLTSATIASAATNPAFAGNCTGTASSGSCVLDEPEGNNPATYGTVTYTRNGDVITFTINYTGTGSITEVQICMQTSGPFEQAANACAGNNDPRVNFSVNGNQYTVDLVANKFVSGDEPYFTLHVNAGGRTLQVIGGGPDATVETTTTTSTTSTTSTTAPTTTTSTSTTAPTTTTSTSTTAPTTTTSTTAPTTGTTSTTTSTLAPTSTTLAPTSTTLAPTSTTLAPTSTTLAPSVLGVQVVNPQVSNGGSNEVGAGSLAPEVLGAQVNPQVSNGATNAGLAATGSSTTSLFLSGLGLILLGTTLLLVSRRYLSRRLAQIS